jgi:ABC-type branched-subunit amino acid transport system substrate-binding protein
VADPAVIVVIGHWLPETTAAAAPIYAAAGLPFIAGGEPPLTAGDPRALPEALHRSYAAVTPFDEEAGPYAGPAYDALHLALAAIATAAQERPRAVDRAAVAAGLHNLTVQGITGPIYQRP